MSVSYENSKPVFQGIKAAGITSVSALPETWLGLLVQQAERDADVTLIQVVEAAHHSIYSTFRISLIRGHARSDGVGLAPSAVARPPAA